MKKITFILFAACLTLSAATCAPRGGEPPDCITTNVGATDMTCTLSVADNSDATCVSEVLGANVSYKYSTGVFEPTMKLNLAHHKGINLEIPLVKRFKPSVRLKKQIRPPSLTKQADGKG